MSLSWTHGLVAVTSSFAVRDGLCLSLCENLLDDLVLIAGAELILQTGIAGSVQPALCTVLVCKHDLEAVYYLRQRNRFVIFPCFEVFGGFDKDDEVVGAALVEDFGDVAGSTRHIDVLSGGEEVRGIGKVKRREHTTNQSVGLGKSGVWWGGLMTEVLLKFC